MRTEVWSVSDFMARRDPRVEGGLSDDMKVRLAKLAAAGLVGSVALDVVPVHAAGAVSTAFDQKIWPLMLDIGQPLAKTMMAIGIYKCIRSDVEGGWKMVVRSGVGLMGLFLIDGAIHILAGVGADLSKN